MKYCSDCGSEFQDTAVACSDCQGSQLLSLEAARAQGVVLDNDTDTRKFVRADTAEDPLTAEQLTYALKSAGIQVFARPRRGSSMDLLSTGISHPWWELLVPEGNLEAAVALLRDERARLAASADDNSRAAEEESQAEGAIESAP